jgi:hypothetical protein
MFRPQAQQSGCKVGAYHHQHKKRRIEKHQGDFAAEENLFSVNVHGPVNSLNHPQSANRNQLPAQNGTIMPYKSPTGVVPQQFIRASTIKLLDTYQRCGQKVSFFPIGTGISSD